MEITQSFYESIKEVIKESINFNREQLIELHKMESNLMIKDKIQYHMISNQTLRFLIDDIDIIYKDYKVQGLIE